MGNSAYELLLKRMPRENRRWLVTGAAGFIGSNLVEQLLRLDQTVVGLDNFSTGKKSNLDEVGAVVGNSRWENFSFIEGDIRDLDSCRKVCARVDFVLHQAALGSVPRSIDDPIATNASNVTGFLNMLVSARDAGVKRFVYAASSSTYGDHPVLPKVEDQIGRPLSPYAVTKYVNELYADVFGRCYGVETIGLRYFNVFGKRQDPDGAYAAVIPKWVGALIRREQVEINGTGETSRDFCYVGNAVQANLLAATTTEPAAVNQVYNIAVNASTDLNQLFVLLRDALAAEIPAIKDAEPLYKGFRAGDVLHSLADISKAAKLLGYAPSHTILQGLHEALPWYIKSELLRL
ncbi:MAG: SDR family oxidoreductase [Geobacteraceae bacterium]|nr:SDR family oxidoreductase [Geobacteraceae bacterium]